MNGLQPDYPNVGSVFAVDKYMKYHTKIKILKTEMISASLEKNESMNVDIIIFSVSISSGHLTLST